MSATDALAIAHPTLGTLTLRRYGRSHLLVDVAGPREVSALHSWVADRHPELDPRPGWASLLVAGSDLARIASIVQHADVAEGVAEEAGNSAAVTIDVIYDGDDLEVVAEMTGLSATDVIALHSGADYRVVFLGFTRGFAYLAGLPPALAVVPRLATPRVRVPAGSVGIAAGQTGVYPMDSPGGWHLLGRATTVPFDPSRSPPSPLSAGSVVRFRAVS